MKIAQVAPLYESVPPHCYGGTERVVSYLTEELVRQGHQVTLFASGDSITQGRLVAPCPQALRLNPTCIDSLAHHMVMLEQVFATAADFDLVHFHIDYLHFPLSSRHAMPTLTTLHGRLDIPDLVPLFQAYPDMPVISLSESQREPLPWLNWQGTVYHGLPEELYNFHEEPGAYLAFIGRISPEKRVDRAIHMATKANMPLKIAAKVDPVDHAYFETVIKPLLDHPLVDYIGEIGDHEKNDFLGQAYALLFPIDWPEPFGLVMIEALACGTPVIAHRQGSVPEIIEPGVTGWIVNSLDDAVVAIQQVSTLSRRRCRQVFEERFLVSRMAKAYVRLYQTLLEKRNTSVAS
jgi:glycosyltransferase involved in cell wall biosynthesis